MESAIGLYGDCSQVGKCDTRIVRSPRILERVSRSEPSSLAFSSLGQSTTEVARFDFGEMNEILEMRRALTEGVEPVTRMGSVNSWIVWRIEAESLNCI